VGTGPASREELEEELRFRQEETEAERRRFLYVDVEALIETGFLFQQVRMDSSFFVVRSLSPSQLHQVESRARTVDGWTRWALSQSVWIVDGFDVTVVPNHMAWVHRLWVQNLPNAYIKAFYATFRGLQRRQERAQEKIHAYCSEPYGTHLYQLRRDHTIPHNSVRDLWSVFNVTRERRTQNRADWSRTQAVVGASNAKGAKAIKRQFDKLRQSEDSRAARVIEDMVNRVIQGSGKPEQRFVMVDGKQVAMPHMRASHTVSEMQEEMRRVVENDPDYHDLAVQNYEQRLREAVAEKKESARHRHQQQEGMANLMRKAGIGGTTRLVGYAPDQVPNRPHSRPQGVKKSTTASGAHRLFDRYVKDGTKAGQIGLKGVPEATAGEHPDGPLQQQISSRKPSLRSDPMGPTKVRADDGD
jgi:hypothetical protein